MSSSQEGDDATAAPRRSTSRLMAVARSARSLYQRPEVRDLIAAALVVVAKSISRGRPHGSRPQGLAESGNSPRPEQEPSPAEAQASGETKEKKGKRGKRKKDAAAP